MVGFVKTIAIILGVDIIKKDMQQSQGLDNRIRNTVAAMLEKGSW